MVVWMEVAVFLAIILATNSFVPIYQRLRIVSVYEVRLCTAHFIAVCDGELLQISTVALHMQPTQVLNCSFVGEARLQLLFIVL